MSFGALLLKALNSMFTYHSVQIHSNTVNGKTRTKKQEVNIKGKNGTKSVTIRNGASKKTMKKRLKAKEIKCIQRCQYLPGLFTNCKPC